MDFTEKVNEIKNGILKRPQYRVPLEKILTRANGYTSDKGQNESERKEEIAR